MPQDRNRSFHSTETSLEETGSAPWRAPRIPGLTVLYHSDLERIGERALLVGPEAGQPVDLSRREPLFSRPDGGARRPLDDSSLSRAPIRVRVDPKDGSLTLDLSTTRTRVEAAGERVHGSFEVSADRLDTGVVVRLGSRVVCLLHRFDPFYAADLPSYGLVGESDGMQRVRREIGKVADVEVPVLIRGETGCGKELVARAVHDAGPRRDRPFVAVNMAAIPPTLAASELFGAAKGAFTGADRSRQGLFAQAHGGTLFLDEIGETPVEVQPLLLRTLETGEIRPVGGDARRVDIRLLSATDADLESSMAEDRFRAPLFHRLSGFEIHLPALRLRRDDFGRLLKHFLCQELSSLGELACLDRAEPWLPAEQVARLAAYHWPGNVRQLLNVVRQIVVGSRGERRAWLPESVEMLLSTPTAIQSSEGPGTAEDPAPARRRKPSEIDDQALVGLLRSHRFNLRAAAAAAGISPTSLYALIERCDLLRKPSEIHRDEIEAVLEEAGGDIERTAAALDISELGLKRRLKELGLR